MPILMMIFIAIADFGRIFVASIALEAATRNAAEATANRYLAAAPPDSLGVTVPLDQPAPAGDPAYYGPLHTYAAGVVCAELRDLPSTNYDAGTNTCPDMPLVMVCIHDSQDTSCSTVASPGSGGVPAECTGFSPAPNNGQGGSAHPRPRWVEVRTCYHFTAILNLPLFSLGSFYLQRTNEFTIPCYFNIGTDECGDTP
jgi:hypothetical protein